MDATVRRWSLTLPVPSILLLEEEYAFHYKLEAADNAGDEGQEDTDEIPEVRTWSLHVLFAYSSPT